jgi:lactoylglutathione lyase
MLHVKDLEASLTFYTKLLKMKLLRKREYDGYTLAFVGYGDETSNTVIELKHFWSGGEGLSHGNKFGHIAIAVQDLMAVCRVLQEASIKILRPPSPQRPGGATLTFVEDPDGFIVELIELP